MKNLKFDITINASREKVWEVLWNDASYRAWTSVFSEGSRAESDWKKGSKVLFLDSKNDGMISKIAESIPNEFMSFEHVGTVIEGVEDYESEEVKAWSGALENYTLKDVDGKTELKIALDVTNDYADYFNKTWPMALKEVKRLAEN